ncbi:MAG: hypothetical protein EP343_29355 [Deltaproteobacteria bacterium]|nr:MAG: hypothetical protein EP343_29355 [Deltaproteobacteria bacterium]
MSTTPSSVKIALPSQGYTSLSDWNTIAVTGRDRVDFLKGLLTNAIRKLPVGGGNASLFLTVKGRIRGEVLVSKQEDQILLLTAPSEGADLMEFLEHYHVIEKVSFRALEGELVPYVLLGESLPSVLEESGLAMPEVGHGLDLSELLGVQDSSIWATRLAQLGELPMLLTWIPKESTPTWEERLSAWKLSALPSDDFAKVRVAGNWFSKAEVENALVHEANLQDTHVDFKKGCFVGQEVVARTEHRGKANKRLVALGSNADSTLEVGAAIHNEAGKEVGTIVAVWPNIAEASGTVYRALLRVQAWEEDQELSVPQEGMENVILHKIEFQW